MYPPEDSIFRPTPPQRAFYFFQGLNPEFPGFLLISFSTATIDPICRDSSAPDR
jgi:hypothetical protein